MVPALCDDILLSIFVHLKPDHLYALSQCSRHFESLAQIAFANTKQTLILCKFDMYLSRNVSIGRIADDRVRVFGHYAKQLFCMCPADEWPLPWSSINLNNLQHLSVDITQLAGLCRRSTRFEQLTRLELWNTANIDSTRYIDFNRWFPKLSTLDMRYDFNMTENVRHYPSGLQSLELCHGANMSADRFKILLHRNPALRHLILIGLPLWPNEVIDIMIEAGIHSTLTRFTFIFKYDGHGPSHQQTYQLNEKLSMFKRLSTLSLVMNVSDCLLTYENVTLLGHMRSVKDLYLGTGMMEMTWQQQMDFVTVWADNVPNNLGRFKLNTFNTMHADARRLLFDLFPDHCKCIEADQNI